MTKKELAIFRWGLKIGDRLALWHPEYWTVTEEDDIFCILDEKGTIVAAFAGELDDTKSYLEAAFDFLAKKTSNQRDASKLETSRLLQREKDIEIIRENRKYGREMKELKMLETVETDESC